MTKLQTLKGFRDFLPIEAKKRQFVLDILKQVFESYGFEPLETPALEYEEILLGKYGDEGDKLMYRFEDNGKRKVALRYDQTVPLARVIAQYQNELPMPFKRYQIQNVWRADNTQKGRYREFLQCDADIVDSSSPLSDAEIIVTAVKSLEELGFKNYKILINDRNSLEEGSKLLGINPNKTEQVIREQDKIGKLSEKEIFQNIFSITTNTSLASVASGTINSLEDLRSTEKAKTIGEWISEMNIKTNDNPKGDTGQILSEFDKAAKGDTGVYLKEYAISEPNAIKEIRINLTKLGLDSEKIIYKRTLARGLSYYTRMIFEVEIESYNAGSVCGGGRYDDLIGTFAGKQIPAVGFSFGFDRLMEAMEELNLFPAELVTTKVLVTVFPEWENKSLEVARMLREENINTEIYLEDAKMEKQLKYADKKQIPYAVIIGTDEAKNDTVTVKDLKTRTQKTLPFNQLPDLFKE